jgi:hypothetical protein
LARELFAEDCEMRPSTDATGRLFGRLLIGLAAALLVTANASAGPISFAGSMSGVFGTPFGDASTGEGTDTISYGTPTSVLSFTGTDFTVSAGHVFGLGTVGFFNSGSASSITAVDIGLNPDFTSGGGAAAFILSLTVNKGHVTLVADNEIGSFLGSDGTTYSLMVKGFGSVGGGSVLSPELTVGHGHAVSGVVYGEFVAKDGNTPTTPEPATLVLAAVGLVTVGIRRRRRR